MKRGYKGLNNPELVALVHLEQAESILSDLDEMADYRKRVTDICRDLGSELMEQSFSELVEEAEEGDTILFDGAADSIENLSSGSTFDASEAIKRYNESDNSGNPEADRK